MEERENDYELDPVVSLGFVLGLPLSKVEAVRKALSGIDGVKLIVSRVGSPKTLWLVRREEGAP